MFIEVSRETTESENGRSRSQLRNASEIRHVPFLDCNLLL